jgi:hypothetical protein
VSEFTVVEYDSFPIEEDRREAPRRPGSPWQWALVGLVVGVVIGLILTFDLPEPSTEDAGPLELSGTTAIGPEPVAAVRSSETLGQAASGFVGEVHVYLATTEGTAHARVLRQRAEPLIVDRSIDPASVPDRRGTNLARSVGLGGTTQIEITSSLALGDGSTIWVGENVTGWAWNRTRGESIAWSESSPAYPDAADIHRWVLGGPPKEPITVGGAWRLVDFQGDSAILVSEDQIGVLDLEFGQLYARTATAPVFVAGIHDGTVLGRAGPDNDSVQIDLLGTYKAAPPWWQPAAGELLADPENGWAVQSYGDTAALVDPVGVTEHVATTALPAWSANRNHLVVPQGSRLVIIDLRDGSRSAIDLGAPIERVWVSG